MSDMERKKRESKSRNQIDCNCEDLLSIKKYLVRQHDQRRQKMIEIAGNQ
jgi:hypothetical protein